MRCRLLWTITALVMLTSCAGSRLETLRKRDEGIRQGTTYTFKMMVVGKIEPTRIGDILFTYVELADYGALYSYRFTYSGSLEHIDTLDLVNVKTNGIDIEKISKPWRTTAFIYGFLHSFLGHGLSLFIAKWVFHIGLLLWIAYKILVYLEESETETTPVNQEMGAS